MPFTKNPVQLVVHFIWLVLVADKLEEFVDVFGRHFEQVLLRRRVHVFGWGVLGCGEVLGAELFEEFEAFLSGVLWDGFGVAEGLEHAGGEDRWLFECGAGLKGECGTGHLKIDEIEVADWRWRLLLW